MKRSRRTTLDGFSLSFLDCICCGFGAIILLLVLVKIGEPRAIERATEDLEGLVARLQQELFEIRGETNIYNRELTSKQEQLSQERERIARLKGDLTRIQGEFAATSDLSEVQEIIEGRLLAAQQKLNEEMKRLQARTYYRRPPDAPVGGIPVDSEYVIFVIDTSGSMFNYAWPTVVQKMRQTLEIYPRVKGIQVMNDMGQYMFSRYKGKWIPDTPARRKAILERLKNWSVFSNSSPVEGLTAAIRTFGAKDKKVSVYVFGDEFTGDSIDKVVRTIDDLNPRDQKGRRQVRIHAVGFPVMFKASGVREFSGVRFATLMRILTHEHDGTFVALNSLKR